ncbi:MAG: hypothetical protein LH619_09845, partial [Chitinophagaceae bacterium]|nr:hypothetical protein [Chitinophagaceae bacterium]
MGAAKKILLVQLYSNGDCLYATAVARQIKKDFPDCHLAWVIAGFCKNIIAQNPYVDEILVTNEVAKNDIIAFRKFKRKVFKEKKEGKWDEIFVTHNMDDNQALYDGTIRGMIFRAYPNPVSVPVQPVLVLTEEEKLTVKKFAENNKLQQFSNTILWEYAPQSGQSVLSFDFVMKTAKRITQIPGTCVILSSANSFPSTEKIIDASNLAVRENAELIHYCSLFIGCSSGITWLSTSSAAKQLPMLQLLDPQAYFRNAPSVDFQRYGISTNELIELVQYDDEKIYRSVKSILDEGIVAAKIKFNEALPVQFNTTRKVVYNLLCY